jgi:hypothetical protein
VTPEERAEAIAYCGFREPIEDRWPISLAILCCSLVGFGGFALILGADIQQRITGLVMLVIGVPIGWRHWLFLRRPVAPRDDDDLARELRHRKQLGQP